MSTTEQRTLVVDLAWLECYQAKLLGLANMRAHAMTVGHIIAHGTPVEMEPHKVAGLARAFHDVMAPVHEEAWQAAERQWEQFCTAEDDRIYSEAQAADEEADLSYDPSCNCNYCRASCNADSGLSPAGGAA